MRNVLSGFLSLSISFCFLPSEGIRFLANLLPRSLRLASIPSSGYSHRAFFFEYIHCRMTRFAVGVRRYLTSLLLDAYTPKPRINPLRHTYVGGLGAGEARYFSR
jgi:hypothetical protein